MKSWYSTVHDIELKDKTFKKEYSITFETDSPELKIIVETLMKFIMDSDSNERKQILGNAVACIKHCHECNKCGYSDNDTRCPFYDKSLDFVENIRNVYDNEKYYLSVNFNRGYTKAIQDIIETFKYIQYDLKSHKKNMNMKLALSLLNTYLKNRVSIRDNMYNISKYKPFIRFNSEKQDFEYFYPKGEN